VEIDALTNDQGLMVRSFAIRAKDSAKREFTGIGVPYGETYDMGYGYREQFDPGSITGGDSAKIFWQHREVIGKVLSARETPEGYEIRAKISDTQLGRDAWTLLADEAVDSLSIGFRPGEYRTEKDDDGDTTVIHTKVEAREFSLVNFPAYTNAKISEIRSARTAPKETPMEPDLDTITRAEYETQQDAIAVLERQFAALPTQAVATPIPEFRSIGEFVRAIANQDEAALNLHRDFAGGVLADAVVKDSWIGEYIHFVEARRRIFNQFGKGVLPAEGANVEYAQLKSNTIVVGEQLQEGDDLTKAGKIELETKTAPKKTDGAWTELSFQSIKQATIPVLDGTWKALLLKYAANTEARARAAYLAVINAKLASATEGAFLDIAAAATTDDWLDLIVDAAISYEQRGHVLSGMNVSVNQFKRLMRLRDGDNRLMNVYGTGVNMVGEMNLKQVDGSLAGLQVSLLDTTSTDKIAFYDPAAMVTLESPGAPIQLQDENIINLSKQISIHGQTANTNPFPDAILPVKLVA